MRAGAWRIAPLAAALAAVGCLGPASHPVTGPVPAGATVRVTALRDPAALVLLDTAGAPIACAARVLEGRLRARSGDTLDLASVTMLERPAPLATAPCTVPAVVRVLAPAGDARLERLEPVGAVRQAVGSAVLIYAMVGASLLLYNAIDGLVHILERL